MFRLYKLDFVTSLYNLFPLPFNKKKSHICGANMTILISQQFSIYKLTVIHHSKSTVVIMVETGEMQHNHASNVPQFTECRDSNYIDPLAFYSSSISGGTRVCVLKGKAISRKMLSKNKLLYKPRAQYLIASKIFPNKKKIPSSWSFC